MRRALLFLSLLLLAACGQSEKTTYRIGRDANWYPIDLLGRENAVTLFSDELVREIGREEGFRPVMYSLEGPSLVHQLYLKELNGILTSIPPEPQFRKIFDFSDVYLYVGPVLVVGIESSATSLNDLAGKTVGVVGGLTDVLVGKIPNVVISRYQSPVMALQALHENTIDGAVITAIPAYAYIRDLYQTTLKVVTPPLTDDGLRLVVMKGENKDLLEAFNRGLREAIAKGTYEELQQRWQLDLDQGPRKSAVGNLFDPSVSSFWAQLTP